MLRIFTGVMSLVVCLMFGGATHAAEALGVQPPPVEKKFDPFYTKCVSVDGFCVLSSDKVPDAGLLEAAYLIGEMLHGRDDILQAMVESNTRFSVMAHDELTTSIPEHSDLTPSKYWDRRARGLGATRRRPSVSCGVENLLNYPGDPYRTENILIHEFAHAIHQMGVNNIDKEFQGKLDACFKAAMDDGLWKDKYASGNASEYWAEGVQSWFGTNRENDHDHNHVNTRAELKEYDPRLAELIESVFGPREWTYTRAVDRKDAPHLANYDFSQSPKFSWPEELLKWYAEYEKTKKGK